MPDGDTHAVGAFIFFIFYFILSLILAEKDDLLLQFIAGLFVSQLGGSMPDIIEPPTWPGHRGVFHYGVGFLTFIPALLLITSTNLLSFSIGSFSVGYFSHFILDVYG